MVPQDGRYYSVFPLGAVLSMLPVAILQKIHVIKDFPGRALAALVAALSVWFLFRLSIIGTKSLPKRILFSLVPIFGSWTWCNLGFGGAWQIALGLALLGQIAALYFVLVHFRPVIAGAFFAMAIGNRTEVVLCLPVFLFSAAQTARSRGQGLGALAQQSRQQLRVFVYFLIVPVALGFFTALYNYARFHSFFDFGYSHIPNVLKEPWYRHGSSRFMRYPGTFTKCCSKVSAMFPPFPTSVLLRSAVPFFCEPVLLLIFREGGIHKAATWIAIGLLTFALWTHGNPGGWEFSYRYATVLLPWMFLLFLGTVRQRSLPSKSRFFVFQSRSTRSLPTNFLWTKSETSMAEIFGGPLPRNKRNIQGKSTVA